jgi:hypothetical protein
MYFTWKREKCKKKKEERTTGPPLTRSTPGGRACGGASSDTMKGYFWTNIVKRARTPPTHWQWKTHANNFFKFNVKNKC